MYLCRVDEREARALEYAGQILLEAQAKLALDLSERGRVGFHLLERVGIRLMERYWGLEQKQYGGVMRL